MAILNSDKILTYFDKYLPLDEKEKLALSNCIVERRIKRRQFILQEGDVCRHYSFIVSGLFKMYTSDQNGREYNLQFSAENDWINDIGSFNTKKPSKFFIEAVESSVIIQIEKSALIDLLTNFSKFERIFRVIIEDKFICLENRLMQKICSSTEEHYHTFVNEYPQLAQRLPNTQIASYLGITPEFLSKIRNTRIRKGV
ncbi:MAG: Crp/Fnr family transcriptional regulator [Saprospiraceae bacterium]